MYKYTVFDKKQHIITKFSSLQVSIYTYQKFSNGADGDQTCRAPDLLRSGTGYVHVWRRGRTSSSSSPGCPLIRHEPWENRRTTSSSVAVPFVSASRWMLTSTMTCRTDTYSFAHTWYTFQCLCLLLIYSMLVIVYEILFIISYSEVPFLHDDVTRQFVGCCHAVSATALVYCPAVGSGYGSCCTTLSFYIFIRVVLLLVHAKCWAWATRSF